MYPAVAASKEQSASLWRCCDPNGPSILRRRYTFCQATPNQSLNNAAHGWRFDLFGTRQLTQRFGPRKDQNREGRELCRANLGLGICWSYEP